MTIAQMLSQSGILTLLGMCVVFAFLIILILSMTLLRLFVRAFHLDNDLEKKDAPAGNNAVSVNDADQGAVIAAIAAAVHEKESN